MRTTYLGRFTDEVANAIAGDLERAHIHWHYKQASMLTRMFMLGEWGTRLFVDADKLDRARRIAERVARNEQS
jgi:hypothetical protein